MKMLTDEQIFDILDACASKDTLVQHQNLLSKSAEYKTYFEDLEAVHFDLLTMPIEKPSVQFTENILANFAYAPVKKKSWSSQLIYIFFGVMGSALAAVIIFAFFNLSTTTINTPTNHWFETATIFLTDTFVKIAILANLIVLLVVFDRKVLKPYFNQRKMTLN